MLCGIQKDTKTQSAETLLLELLANGEKPQSEILEHTKQAGISKRLVGEVKKNLNIKSIKKGDKWYWELPNN
ncbi:MAG: hypothetical protein ACK5LZ_00210 [Anaerorhabdus sp.]